MNEKPRLPALPWRSWSLTMKSWASWLPQLSTWKIVPSNVTTGSWVVGDIAKNIAARAEVVVVDLRSVLDLTESTLELVSWFRWSIWDIVSNERKGIQLNFIPWFFHWWKGDDWIWYWLAGERWDTRFYEGKSNRSGSTHITAWLQAVLRENFKPWSLPIVTLFTDDPLSNDKALSSEQGRSVHRENLRKLKESWALLVVAIDRANWESCIASWKNGFWELGENLVLVWWASDVKSIIEAFIGAKVQARAASRKTIDIKLVLPSLAMKNPNLAIATGGSNQVFRITDQSK